MTIGKGFLIPLLAIVAVTSGCSSRQTVPQAAVPVTTQKLSYAPRPVAPPLTQLQAQEEPLLAWEQSVIPAKVEVETPKIHHDSLWSLVQHEQGIQFDVNHPRIQQEMKRYTRKPGYLKHVTKRSEPFLYHIVRQLQAHNLPLDLVALPVIESAYNPHAISKSGAAGLWQFISSTGKIYGLEQGRWYDARHDLLPSTKAAAQYLTHLVEEFQGDWALALASYNAGETTVRKAIERNRKRGKPTDYWHLRLPEETMSYVPRFLGVVAILRNPERYGIQLWDIPLEPYFDSITVEARTSLNKLARNVQTNSLLIKNMNAGFRQGMTPPRKLSKVLVPKNALQPGDVEDLQQISAKPAAVLPQHYVRAGETLSYIARLYGIPVQQIMYSNQLLGNDIQVGQTLAIPES